MQKPGNGGTVEAIYTSPLVRRRVSVTTALASIASFVGEVLVTSARGDDFDRTFSRSSGAQFAALSSASKDKLLGRGFRP
jgi:drug/metabolite transporter (DMT)-like permease